MSILLYVSTKPSTVFYPQKMNNFINKHNIYPNQIIVKDFWKHDIFIIPLFWIF